MSDRTTLRQLWVETFDTNPNDFHSSAMHFLEDDIIEAGLPSDLTVEPEVLIDEMTTIYYG